MTFLPIVHTEGACGKAAAAFLAGEHLDGLTAFEISDPALFIPTVFAHGRLAFVMDDERIVVGTGTVGTEWWLERFVLWHLGPPFWFCSMTTIV